MSEQGEDQGKWVWAFLLGVLVGALLMVGVGGGLWMVQARSARDAAMQIERARMVEMEAREEAERARQEAERALMAAEEAGRKAEAVKAGKK